MGYILGVWSGARKKKRRPKDLGWEGFRRGDQPRKTRKRRVTKSSVLCKGGEKGRRARVLATAGGGEGKGEKIAKGTRFLLAGAQRSPAGGTEKGRDLDEIYFRDVGPRMWEGPDGWVVMDSQWRKRRWRGCERNLERPNRSGGQIHMLNLKKEKDWKNDSGRATTDDGREGGQDLLKIQQRERELHFFL